METGKTLSAWLSRKYSKWLVVLTLVIASYGLIQIYKELTMSPPLVFLIPEDYFGPVFVFFGQKDGLDVQPDPLGHAIAVPENGVVKIRQSHKEFPYGDASPTYRPVWYVSLAKNGQRKVMTVVEGTQRDENGKFADYVLDQHNATQKYIFEDLEKAKQDPFYYFSQTQRNQRMIFNRDTCSHQDFINDAALVEKLDRREISAEAAGVPACEKFLVTTPNELVTLPEFMWADAQRYYGSIQEFVDEANERVKKKRAHYHLPEAGQQSGQIETQSLRAKAGTPCPRTGLWESQDAQGIKRHYKEGEPMADLGSSYGFTVWQFVK